MKQHPLSAIFPALPDEELKALAADIKAHGLRSQIVLYKGCVLDGWHRYRACEMVGVKPRTIDYNGDDPKSFVKSANWHRRHLTASQRGFAEVQLSEWLPTGNPALTAPNGAIGKSKQEMAAEANVGTKTIERAKKVQTNGAEVLKEAVKEGSIAIDKAAKIATLPKEKQAKAMKERAPKKAKTAKADGTDWKAKYDALLEDYNALKENRDDLADELKACEAVRTDTAVLEMKKLQAEVKHCTRRRDELMASNHEMRKECTRWQDRAKKAGWRPHK